MTASTVLGSICFEFFYINQGIHIHHLFSGRLAELSLVGFPPGFTTKTLSLINNQPLLICSEAAFRAAVPPVLRVKPV